MELERAGVSVAEQETEQEQLEQIQVYLRVTNQVCPKAKNQWGSHHWLGRGAMTRICLECGAFPDRNTDQ